MLVVFIGVKRLGIIGGLGPQTSCKFCLSVNQKFIRFSNRQPDIVLENVPLSKAAEQELINGEPSPEAFDLISRALKRLNNAGADVIAMPCNTAHIFIKQLRKISKIPILSIIEESAKECKKNDFKKVLLLGSSGTIKAKLHQTELKKFRIKTTLVRKKDQEIISNIIIRILNDISGNDDIQKLLSVISQSQKRGAQAVIFGCTDLQLLIPKDKCAIPVIDTCEVLENASVRFLLNSKEIMGVE